LLTICLLTKIKAGRYYFKEKKSQNKKFVEITSFELDNFREEIKDIDQNLLKKI